MSFRELLERLQVFVVGNVERVGFEDLTHFGDGGHVFFFFFFIIKKKKICVVLCL